MSTYQNPRPDGTVEAVGADASTVQKLAAVQQVLTLVLSSIDGGLVSTDRDGRLTAMNAVTERLSGWTQHDALGRHFADVMRFEKDPGPWHTGNPVLRMAENDWAIARAESEVIVARDGTRTPVELRGTLLLDSGGTTIGMTLLIQDATPQSLAAAESNRLAAIVASSNDAIVGKTLDGRITSWNRAAERMFGYSAEEAVGQSIYMLIPQERSVEERNILAALAQGITVPAFDTQRRARDGTLLEVSVTVSPIRDAQGRIVGASKIARDVSHVRRAEAALRHSRELVETERLSRQRVLEASLREKEVLLKEIHHRVKNNLQVLSSLLQLQGASLQDEAIRLAFEQSQGRIRSMALVHERLYESQDMANIDFGGYVRDLVSGLVGSYDTSGGAVTVAVDVGAAPVQLGVDRAIPCGLILNELVSNALKHGFPSGRSGRIVVRLALVDEDTISLAVDDDGAGWPVGFDPARVATLGLRLVHLLSRQIGASLRWRTDQGIGCTLVLPRVPPGA